MKIKATREELTQNFKNFYRLPNDELRKKTSTWWKKIGLDRFEQTNAVLDLNAIDELFTSSLSNCTNNEMNYCKKRERLDASVQLISKEFSTQAPLNKVAKTSSLDCCTERQRIGILRALNLDASKNISKSFKENILNYKACDGKTSFPPDISLLFDANEVIIQSVDESLIIDLQSNYFKIQDEIHSADFEPSYISCDENLRITVECTPSKYIYSI